MIAPLIQFALWALTFFGDCTVNEAECHYRYDRHTGDLIITCLLVMFPDVDTAPTIDVIGGMR